MAEITREWKDGKTVYTWQGNGLARIYGSWFLGSPKVDFSKPIITLGNLRLRIIGRGLLWEWDTIYVARARGWKLWAIWYCLWRFLCWFERNLRLTAAIWGLLKHDDPACEWRWRDFVLLWWMRKWRKPKQT